MNNEELINAFCFELKELGITSIHSEGFIKLEYPFEQTQQKSAVKILNRYIGFWKTIAIETNHDKANKILRYNIDRRLITGQDISNEQLLSIAGRMAKQL